MSYTQAGQFYYRSDLTAQIQTVYKTNPSAIQGIPAGAYVTGVSTDYRNVTYTMNNPLLGTSTQQSQASSQPKITDIVNVASQPTTEKAAIEQGYTTYIPQSDKDKYYKSITEAANIRIAEQEAISESTTFAEIIGFPELGGKIAPITIPTDYKVTGYTTQEMQGPLRPGEELPKQYILTLEKIGSPTSTPPASLASQVEKFSLGGGLLGMVGLGKSGLPKTGIRDEQTQAATSIVATGESLFYGTGSLLTAIPTSIQKGQLSLGSGWEMMGIRTPDLKPVVSSALIGSAVTSVMSGRLAANQELVELSKQSPVYWGASVLTDIVGSFALGGVVSKGFGATKTIVGDSLEGVYGAYKNTRGFGGTLLKEVSPSTYIKYEYFAKPGFLEKAAKVESAIGNVASRVSSKITTAKYSVSNVVDDIAPTAKSSMLPTKANIISAKQRLPDILKGGDSEFSSFMYSVASPNLKNYSKVLTPSVKLGLARNAENIQALKSVVPNLFEGSATKAALGKTAAVSKEAQMFMGNVALPNLGGKVSKATKPMKDIFQIPSPKNYPSEGKLATQAYNKVMAVEQKALATKGFSEFKTTIRAPALKVSQTARQSYELISRSITTPALTKIASFKSVITGLAATKVPTKKEVVFEQKLIKSMNLDLGIIKESYRRVNQGSSKTSLELIPKSVSKVQSTTKQKPAFFSGVPNLVGRQAQREEQQYEVLSYPNKSSLILDLPQITTPARQNKNQQAMFHLPTNILASTTPNKIELANPMRNFKQQPFKMPNLLTTTKQPANRMDITNLPRYKTSTSPQIMTNLMNDLTFKNAQATSPMLKSLTLNLTSTKQITGKISPLIPRFGGPAGGAKNELFKGSWYQKKHPVKTYKQMMATFGIGKQPTRRKRRR
jgi:hypothetical protein